MAGQPPSSCPSDDPWGGGALRAGGGASGRFWYVHRKTLKQKGVLNKEPAGGASPSTSAESAISPVAAAFWAVTDPPMVAMIQMELGGEREREVLQLLALRRSTHQESVTERDTQMSAQMLLSGWGSICRCPHEREDVGGERCGGQSGVVGGVCPARRIKKRPTGRQPFFFHRAVRLQGADGKHTGARDAQNSGVHFLGLPARASVESQRRKRDAISGN